MPRASWKASNFQLPQLQKLMPLLCHQARELSPLLHQKVIILSLLVYLSVYISLTCFFDDCCFNESEDILPALMATDAMRCNRRVNFLAGYSAANSMQLEAAMCPMTMYELGKSQKLYAETNAQLQRANSLNSVLMSEKRTLQNENAVSCLYSACYFFIIFLFNILTVWPISLMHRALKRKEIGGQGFSCKHWIDKRFSLTWLC